MDRKDKIKDTVYKRHKTGTRLSTADIIEYVRYYYPEVPDGSILPSDFCSNHLKKLDLIREYQGSWLAVNALVLFSDSPVRGRIFPYAKIECARFKGTTSHEFIDQKTLNDNISIQSCV